MKVALIELNNYHYECLYSQIRFLKEEDTNITLIVTPKFENQNSAYKQYLDDIYYYDKKASLFFIKRLFLLICFCRYIINKKFDKIIFNTASSSKTVIFITFILRLYNIECIGTIHNLKKMTSSFSQKLINKNIKKYFVLNDFLLNSKMVNNPKIRLSSYYPIFFPEYNLQPLNKPVNETWICIPGEVNFKRRDYNVVIESLLKSEHKRNLKFIILGKVNAIPKDSEVFLELIKKSGLKSQFITFNSFVENDLFFSYLKASDFILANLQINDDSYLKYKISGVLNLAFGLQKPLIINSELKGIQDLSQNTLFYKSSDDLSSMFNTIEITKENSYIKDVKMDFSYQQKKYMEFINS